MLRVRSIDASERPSSFSNMFAKPPPTLVENDGSIALQLLGAPGEEDWSLNLDFLEQRPKFAEALLNFLSANGAGREPGTQQSRTKLLRYFFADFLRVYERVFEVEIEDLSDFSENIFTSYIRWLNGSHSLMSKLKLKDSTKISRYNIIAEFWRESKMKYCSTSVLVEFVVPTHPWKAVLEAKYRPLTLFEIAALRKACIQEIDHVFALFKVGQEAVNRKSGIDVSREDVTTFRTLEACIEGTWIVFKDGTKDMAEIHDTNRGLWRSLHGHPYFSVRFAISHLFLTNRAIVPFILLVALETGYNTSTLLGLSWENVDDHPIWPNRVILTPYKKRARAIQQRSFSTLDVDPYSVTSLLAFLETVTSEIRTNIRGQDQDRVFVTWRSLKGQLRSFIPREGEIESNWFRSLSKFLEENGFEGMTISDVRLTVADLVDRISFGDVNARAEVLGHRSNHTPEKHYRTAEMDRRRADMLAIAIQLHQRMIDSDGKVKPQYTNGVSRGATPGFYCLDMFSSPILGQKIGRPCSAYCKCPACPLAAFDPGDPIDVAHLVLVGETIESSRHRLSPQRWINEWSPQLDAVNHDWLPLVNGSLMAAAKEVSLHPIPEVE